MPKNRKTESGLSERQIERELKFIRWMEQRLPGLWPDWLMDPIDAKRTELENALEEIYQQDDDAQQRELLPDE